MNRLCVTSRWLDVVGFQWFRHSHQWPLVAAASHRMTSAVWSQYERPENGREIVAADVMNRTMHSRLGGWTRAKDATTEVPESAEGNAANRELSAVICEHGLASAALVK